MSDNQKQEVVDRIEGIKQQVAALDQNDPSYSRLQSLLQYQIQKLQSSIGEGPNPTFPF